MTNIIGKNVKALRESIGFTQANIATFLNVDQSMISKIENGEEILSIDRLEKLSCLFGVTVEEIEKDIIKEPSLLTKYKVNELIIENMEAFSAINKIAMNVTFMDELLNEKTNNWLYEFTNTTLKYVLFFQNTETKSFKTPKMIKKI